MTRDENNEIENLYKFNHTHKKRDWISMSKSLIETYDIRLKSYLSIHEIFEESDFVDEEIEKFESLILDKNKFTNGIVWDVHIKNINKYLNFLKNKNFK
jgi:hypothetical protein